MLRKLMKYDIKATARIALPLYAVVFIFSIVTRILYELPIEHELFKAFVAFDTVIFVLVEAATVISTFILLFGRFYKNYYTDEGYLMLTLPVKRYSLILSKIFTSFIFLITNYITLLVTAIIAGLEVDFPAIFTIFKEFVLELCCADSLANIKCILFILLMIIGIILYQSYVILYGYTSLSLGQVIIPNHKILGAVISAVGIYFTTQIVNVIIVVCAIFIFNRNGILSSTDWKASYTFFYGGALVLLYAVYVSAFYLINNAVLKKKINL